MRRTKAISYFIVLAVVFVMMMLWVVKGSQQSDAITRENSMAAVKERIGKSIRLCYSIEGIYPPEIEYLEENYGLVIEDNYYVHYEIFADNIMPQYEVYEMEGNDAKE